MSIIDVAKSYIQAVQTGDQAGLGRLLSPEIVWHQPGRNRFSGTYRGLPSVVGLIGSMMERSQGTFAISRVAGYMANGDWVAVELEFSGRRDGTEMSQPGIDLLRIEGGRVVEARLFSSDQAAEDEFWGR